MTRSGRVFLATATAAVLLVVPVLPARAAGPLRLAGAGWSVTFDGQDGSLRAATAGGKTILLGGEHGLWRVRLADGRALSAKSLLAGGGRFESGPGTGGGLRMAWRGGEVVVVATVRPRKDGVSFLAEATALRGALTELALPARLRARPAAIESVVFPTNGNFAVGIELLGSFFSPQPRGKPGAWRRGLVGGPREYVRLFGGPLNQRPVEDAAVALRPTAAAARWLGKEMAARAGRARAVVNRAPARGQADVVLIDSAHGPWLSASRLGGKGLLWRIGGPVDGPRRSLARGAIAAVVGTLCREAPAGRRRLGLVRMTAGPSAGAWADVSVEQWQATLKAAAGANGSRVRLAVLTAPAEVLAAAAADEFVAILNPYGEALPAASGGLAAACDAVGRYVRAGGQWIEVGGYSFYYALEPVRHYRIDVPYPAAMADFFHVSASGSSVAIYRVQPRTWEPFAGAKDANAIFIPGRLACGGDESGAFFERSYCPYISAGGTRRLPPVRMVFGGGPAERLVEYRQANGLYRPLSEKMPAATLARFRRAVLVKYDAPAATIVKHLDDLPAGSLIHISDYLRGGFDKQYPDHLPPNAGFGGPAGLAELYARARAAGHLMMPYTNTTWWCDKPRGPTFARFGDGPLLRTLTGALREEKYGSNTGFSVCFWDKRVRGAHERVRDQFTRKYRSDLLFQDQCGARGWLWDTHPASATREAYTEGLLSLVQEDSRHVPLSTESGWDRVMPYEAQLCGMTWSLVPTPGAPSWRRAMTERFAPGTWRIYPMAQILAHDQASLIHHDLGQFVVGREMLAWTLGLGYGMSLRVHGDQVAREPVRGWLGWLDRVQKAVCARYVGRGVRRFSHAWIAPAGQARGTGDGGVIRAVYGPVRVVANLGGSPRAEGPDELAGYGFAASAPGMRAGWLSRAGRRRMGADGVGYTVETTGRGAEAWLYASPGAAVAIRLPAGNWAAATAEIDGAAVPTDVNDGVLAVRLPGRGPGRPRLWHVRIDREQPASGPSARGQEAGVRACAVSAGPAHRKICANTLW